MLTEITDERVSDATLVARSLSDPEAFAALFDRYAPLIHRYAARRLGTEAADDVMAETFAVAFQRRASSPPLWRWLPRSRSERSCSAATRTSRRPVRRCSSPPPASG
jgi:DNA-directed RNA polymerase specialized sigma24 family protein